MYSYFPFNFSYKEWTYSSDETISLTNTSQIKRHIHSFPCCLLINFLDQKLHTLVYSFVKSFYLFHFQITDSSITKKAKQSRKFKCITCWPTAPHAYMYQILSLLLSQGTGHKSLKDRGVYWGSQCEGPLRGEATAPGA